MYCKNCGSILEQGAQFCRACGAQVDCDELMKEPAQKTEPAVAQETVQRTVYVQPAHVQAPIAPAPPATNDMAVVGFIMAFMMPILGLVFSVIGLKKAKSGAPNRGLALAGVIISSVYLALSVLAALLYMLWFLFVFWMIGSAGSTYASSAVLAIGSIII